MKQQNAMAKKKKDKFEKKYSRKDEYYSFKI